MLASLLNEIDKLQEEINSFRPLDTKIIKQLKDYYRIGLTYTSNALEGNSLTESETKVVLEDGITIGGKPLKDHYEAEGHGEAYDFMHTLMKNNMLTESHIKELHKLFYYRIDHINAGIYRKEKIFVTGSRYKFPNPEKIEILMKDFIESLPDLRIKNHPVTFSALVHRTFVFIHPFIDGNGRVARLLMNLVLLQSGFVIAIIPPILRAQYIELLEKAPTDSNPFIEFIANRVKETQKDYLRLLR